MLLSIVIPAYDRPDTLAQAIDSFVQRIVGRFETEVEIIIADDASPKNSLTFVSDLAKKYSFLKYKRYEQNIGLEQNLIVSSEDAKGEYLWIFGDDDFLEPEDALEDIIARLRAGQYDMFVLNRTRRSKDLSKLLSDNWMRLDGPDQAFAGLREFCLKFGFISVIGFISVNIFRREPFKRVNVSRYFGTMYPQLGAMVKAFHDRPVQLISRPLVCHRTETQEEKRAKLGKKAGESDFMADARARDALYFSHPYIAMLADLLDSGAFHSEDIVKIPENTVINGFLIDFLIGCAELSLDYPDRFEKANWTSTRKFFNQLPLTPEQASRVNGLLTKSGFASPPEQAMSIEGPAESRRQMKTISVVTTSYNQADYLDECLTSVRDQSYSAIEHLVFDPGSTDGSRKIARAYGHITLFEEPDEGQSDALNKGFARANGDIIAWLNSDDVFAHSDVFKRVIDRFNQPDAPDIVYGTGIFIAEDGKKLRDVYINKDPASLHWRLQQEDGILQPALFMKRSVIERMGELNGNLHYCMDYEYWIRCMKAGIKFAFLDEDLALARYHDSNKTFGQRGNSYHEVCEMLMGHFGYVNHIWLRRYAEFLCDGFDGVLSNADNSEVGDTKKLESVYDQLLRDYNTSHLIYGDLQANSSQKGKGDTLRELRARKIKPSTPCKEVPLYQESEPGHVMYTVGPKRWAFDQKWKNKQVEKSHAFLRNTIANRTSDVCVIVGNGPSLKKVDLDLLKGHDVIISNNAFLDPKLAEYATFYTVVNYLVAEQSSHNINQIAGIPKILPYWSSYCLNEGDDTYFIDAVGHAAFSKDIFKNASWRHTVTFYNMHVAFGLGYKRAIMIGFDHSYKQAKGVKEGEVILSEDKDENHFDSRYFQGKKWQAANVDMMEEMYKLAKAAFEEDGREIVNATAGGKLELFPRMDLKDALAMKPLPESSEQAAENSSASGLPREQHAQLDETAVVAELMKERRGAHHIMLDVGAHVGTSAEYFHDHGWTIHCFEPDAKNRAQLVERFKTSDKVTIDPRAVSDKPAEGVSFFTSPESTGISGLHAFRDTHQVSDRVDVTTVADIVHKRDLTRIDFLKIDVEGFDLSVLKGVPWNTLKPEVIECEFEDAKTLRLGHDWKFVADFLRDKGYSVYISEWHPIIRYGISHDWKCIHKYPDCEISENAWGNILAFKNDPGFGPVKIAFDQLLSFRTPQVVAKTETPAQSVNTTERAQSIARPLQTANVKVSESKPPMLKQITPSSELENKPEDLSAYVQMARNVHKVSPRLYSLLRFFKRVTAHVWSNKTWTIPALAIVIAFGLAALPEFGLVTDLFRYFTILAGAVIVLALLYIAFRAHAHAETLHIQLGNQNRELADLRESLRSGRALIQAGSQSAIIEHFRNEIDRSVRPDIQKVSDGLNSLQAIEIANSNAQITTHAAMIDKLSRQIDAERNSKTSELTALSSQISEARIAQDRVERAVSDLTVRFDMETTYHGQRLDQLEPAQETLKIELHDEIEKLATAQENQKNGLSDLSTRIDPVTAKFEDLQTGVKSLEVKSGDIEKWAQFNNSVWYQHFNRRLRNEHYAVLDSEWRKRLSVPIARSTLGYMANRACMLEEQLDGRLATSIEDILLRTLVARAIKGNSANILEIGTLFGTGAAIMYDAMVGHFDNIHLTLLDPLEGYYNSSQLDILTGQKVDEPTLRRNLNRVGVTDEQVTLIKHLSTDQEAVEAAAMQEYDLLIIDGDHSYAGVKTDFENYVRNVKLGGFVIFDDYASPDWPEVQEYVDAEMDKSDFVSRVGASWRTCVYRVVKKPAKPRARKTSNRTTKSEASEASE